MAKPKQSTEPVVPVPVVEAAPLVSGTGVLLDPVDLQPVFGTVDGQPVSRVRWLALTAEARKAELVEALKQPEVEEV